MKPNCSIEISEEVPRNMQGATWAYVLRANNENTSNCTHEGCPQLRCKTLHHFALLSKFVAVLHDVNTSRCCALTLHVAVILDSTIIVVVNEATPSRLHICVQAEVFHQYRVLMQPECISVAEMLGMSSHQLQLPLTLSRRAMLDP